MKPMIKPLGIAVATAAAAYSAVATAQTPVVANNALGDTAIVPYYTVEGSWVTGVHVVNTSPYTQVVKFRLRRAPDSMDALDFNIIMSPWDVWTGLISDDESGVITFKNFGDTTCSAPLVSDGTFTMPSIFRDGADTGYVEVIGMGQPLPPAPTMSNPTPDSEDSLIAIAAKHGADGVPADCEAVATNFLRGGTSPSNPGNVDFDTAWQGASDVSSISDGGPNNFEDTPNVLKVSYFIRDTETGVEFGDNAVHLQDFLTESAMTNQQTGVLSGDLTGFDFPDLNGGVPPMGQRDRFELLRAGDVLGVANLYNEWSSNPENGAVVNWVVTMPGQYTMLNFPAYYKSIVTGSAGDCDDTTVPADIQTGVGYDDDDSCDFRDIPVRVSTVPYNREERPNIAPGELVVSPALPGQATELRKEVNLISTNGNLVLGSEADNDVTYSGQLFGWLDLSVTSAADKAQAVCDYVSGGGSIEDVIMDCAAVTGNVPMVGFAAWVRSVNDNPDASYGRIIAHSFASGS